MKKILNINTFGLVPHDKNPRIELGDLTELTASIKQSGIHQPLTVVESDSPGVYVVIMGHRRLQAAMNAGRDTVPCMIVEMTPEEQLEAMLVENMQRSDLTVYEQAKGIQQCIDFGSTVDELAKKTGFSKSTVRSRVKLLELDETKVKKASNATIEEYMLIEQFDDLETRNRLMDHIGTHNLNLEVEKAKLALIPVEVEPKTSISAESKTTVTDKSGLVYKNLRLSFMKDIFKQKISKEIHAQTIFQMTLLQVVTGFKATNGEKVFMDVTSLDDTRMSDDLLDKMNKNKIAYFVATTFALLEENEDMSLLYAYLEAIGYKTSDEETEWLENAKN